MPDSPHHETQRDPFHYRHRNFFVGLFVLIPLIMIPALLAVTVLKTQFMGDSQTLYTECKNGAGLKKNIPVTIRGWKVGSVDRVALNENGLFDVYLRVGRQYMRLVRKDSRARVQQKNIMLGDMEIELTEGSPDAPLARDGDTLIAETPFSTDELIGEVADAVASIKAIMAQIESGNGFVGKLITQDPITDKTTDILVETRELIQETRASLVNANDMMTQFRRAGEQGTGILDSAAVFISDIKTLFGNVNAVLSGLDTLIAEIDSLPGTVGDLVETLHKDAQEADLLLRGMQEHWLLRRSIRKARQKEAAGMSR